MDETKIDQISSVRLLREQVIPIQSLNGFHKHHRIPSAWTVNDVRFLASITEAEVDNDLQQTFAKLRSTFGFKRKQISVSGPRDGSGMITTPYFNYEIVVTLDRDDASKSLWQRSISDVVDPGQTFNAAFQKSFGNMFSILEISTIELLDLEDIVDHVEEAESDNVQVDYDKDLTWCEIQVADSIASVKIRDNSIRVVSRQEVSPRQLLEAFLDVQAKFLADLLCEGNPFLVDI